MPPTQLLKLVASLLDDKGLRQRFNQDPRLVMTEFGLNAAERNKLLTMDPATVAAEVALQFNAFEQEVNNGNVVPGEFPPCSEDYKPELGSGGSEYPAPTPAIYRIRPRTISHAEVAAAGEKLEVVITGKSFARDPDATAKVRRLSDSATWNVNSQLFGTFRCSRLVAVVGPKPPETTLAAGNYQIIVRNNGVDIERVRSSPTDPDFKITP